MKGQSGHAPGTSPSDARVSSGSERGALAVVAIEPRLLSLEDAARYLGVSPWTVRELEWSGVLSRVRIPLGNGRELRKLLFDRADLDTVIQRWKDRGDR